ISILNIFWGVKTRPGFGHRFIEYLTVLVVTPLLLMASLSLSAYLRSPGVVGIVSEWEPFGAYYAMVGDVFASPVFWLTAYYAYAFLPDARVRFGPALHVPAMSLAQAIEAPLAGIKRATEETGTRVSLIACALRTMSPSISNDVAHAAVDYRDEGVVAFDLAGSERGHPARDHAASFRYASRHGLHCTCHAGEGDGPDSVRQALHDCGATRIGHGTRILEDPTLERYVCERRIPLEVCLSSNVHTRTVEAAAAHPVRRYMDAGCVVTLNTDGRLMDGVSLTDELWMAHTELGFTREEIDRVIVNTFESAFLPDGVKTDLVAQVKRELGEIS
ncbi:MAG: adenosine deaminase, partial [Gemmatimonadetes bacterium]|nr:adenosine deaminase [Gemmatimonadota bacterium]